jgi:hypothetical protein
VPHPSPDPVDVTRAPIRRTINIPIAVAIANQRVIFTRFSTDTSLVWDDE